MEKGDPMPENPYAISYGRHAATAPTTANPPEQDLVTPPAPARPIPATVSREAGSVRRTPYSHGRRVFYGVVWAGWTALLTIAGFAALFGGQVLGGLFALAAAGAAGHYDYRIWTWRARRLLFLIIW
jgi:hypothetical protein